MEQQSTDVFEHLAGVLNGRWENRIGKNSSLICSQAKLELKFYEERSQIVLENIHVSPTRTSLGSKAIYALKEYADLTGKEFLVKKIENDGFFSRFPFWSEYLYQDEDGDGEASYLP
jgi:hypothetical protein